MPTSFDQLFSEAVTNFGALLHAEGDVLRCLSLGEIADFRDSSRPWTDHPDFECPWGSGRTGACGVLPLDL